MVPMSVDEERLLSEGKNFEHSGGAIDASKLEVVFRIQKALHKAKSIILTKFSESVSNFLIYALFLLLYVGNYSWTVT